MYQLEVKQYLIEHLFHPKDGWEITVDIDAMERAMGPQHPSDKKEKVTKAEQILKQLSVQIGAHRKFGRVDIAAFHNEKGLYLIEVEGKSSKQKEQAMYSALGQTVLMMKDISGNITYAIAVPDHPDWERQIEKIPKSVRKLLNLKCFLVSQQGIKEK